MSYVKLNFVCVRINFIFHELIFYEHEEGNEKIINIYTGEYLKNQESYTANNETVIIRNKRIDYSRYNYTEYDSGVFSQYDKEKNTLFKIKNVQRFGEEIYFRKNDQPYVLRMSDGKMRPHIAFMRSEFILQYPNIYAPFSLKIMKTICPESERMIFVLLCTIREIKIKIPKYIIENILKLSFQTYDELS